MSGVKYFCLDHILSFPNSPIHVILLQIHRLLFSEGLSIVSLWNWLKLLKVPLNTLKNTKYEIQFNISPYLLTGPTSQRTLDPCTNMKNMYCQTATLLNSSKSPHKPRFLIGPGHHAYPQEARALHMKMRSHRKWWQATTALNPIPKIDLTEIWLVPRKVKINLLDACFMFGLHMCRKYI